MKSLYPKARKAHVKIAKAIYNAYNAIVNAY